MPRFGIGIFVVFVLVVFVVALITVEVVVIVVIVVIIVVESKACHKGLVADVVFCHDVGSVAVFVAFSWPDVGYVDQKWRPHLGQTQN